MSAADSKIPIRDFLLIYTIACWLAMPDDNLCFPSRMLPSVSARTHLQSCQVRQGDNTCRHVKVKLANGAR